jgi:hypothetical protein
MADFEIDRTSPAYLLGVAEYERDKYKTELAPPQRGSLLWHCPGPQTPNRPDLTLTLPRVLSVIERREASDGGR